MSESLTQDQAEALHDAHEGYVAADQGAIEGEVMPTAPKPLHIGPSATSETRRENSHRRGYDRQWNKISKRYLAASVLCALCEGGAETLATEVDHIIPFRGNRI